jgi:hydrogenase maturation factor
MTLLEPDVAVGDWVIVAGGAILRRLDADAALEIASANRLARADPIDLPHDREPPRTEGARDG